VGRSSSKRKHRGTKKGKSRGGVSIESSSRKTISVGQPSSGTKSNIYERRKRKKSQNFLTEEFKKAKPPTFDGEIKKGEEVEAWLFSLKKYFQVRIYSYNTKASIAVFNLDGEDSIWWEDLKKIKRIKEIKLTWKQFEKYFFKSYIF